MWLDVMNISIQIAENNDDSQFGIEDGDRFCWILL